MPPSAPIALRTGAETRLTNEVGRRAVSSSTAASGATCRGRGARRWSGSSAASRPGCRGSRSSTCATGSSPGTASTAVRRTRGRRSSSPSTAAPRARRSSASRWAARSRSRRRRHPAVRAVVGLAPWIPDRLDLVAAARPSDSRSSTARSTATCPASRAWTRAAHGAATSGHRRRRRRRYELIPGGLHGAAVRALGAPRPLPRARRWAQLLGRRCGATRRRLKPPPRALAGVGRFTSQTRPSRSRPRITHHEGRAGSRSQPVPRRGGEGVVVVVPALAEDEQRDEPVVPRLVARAVVLACRTCGRSSSR